MVLFLERPHIETTVYVNGVKVRHQMSLSTPHECDITRWLVPGQRNNIAICVYNGIENVCVGQDSHSVTDQTQGNWNGIAGKMELRSTPGDVYFKKVKLTPYLMTGQVRVDVELDGSDLARRFNRYEPDYPRIHIVIVSDNKPDSVVREVAVGTYEPKSSFLVTLGEEVSIWNEFFPQLYRSTVILSGCEARWRTAVSPRRAILPWMRTRG